MADRDDHIIGYVVLSALAVLILDLVIGTTCLTQRPIRHATQRPALPAPSSPVVSTVDAGVIGGSSLDSEPFPPSWSAVASGVRWRGVRLPLDETPMHGAASARPPREIVWVVLRVDLSRARLFAAHPPDDRLEALREDTQVVAVVNGGYFAPDRAPSGLLISNGVMLAPLHPQGGSGLLVVAEDRADIWTTEGVDAGSLPSRALVVQCGPRLVEQGGVAGIHHDDGRRYARTAACVRNGGHTLDLVATWDPTQPLRGPGLYQFAQMLAGPSPVGDSTGCDLALNLDGGPSTGVFTRGGLRHDPVGPTPWVLEVRP